MEFDSNRPIYLQICDSICERILAGVLKPEERILSVRELGAELGVNPNTVARSYEKLTDEGVIQTRRGLGYFVCPDAPERVVSRERKEFLDNEWPKVLKRAELLKINLKELI